MIITVLWEDSREGRTKGFGAHELRVACVAERLGRRRYEVGKQISSSPKKGAGNVLRALKNDLHRLTKSGPVFAVIDRDKAREIWKPGPLPADCMTAIRDRVAEHVASTGYEIVFLMQNMESLVDACEEGAVAKSARQKPSPDLRDRILGKAASESPAVARVAVLSACPSFARLVERVGARLTASHAANS